MEKKAKSAQIISIIAGVLFFLVAICSLVSTIAISDDLSYTASMSECVSSDYFYANADYVKDYNYSSYSYYYDYYYDYDYHYEFEGSYYDDYDDYCDSVSYYQDAEDGLKVILAFSVISTIIFLLSAVGAFIAKKKAFSIPFLISQALLFFNTLALSIALIAHSRFIYYYNEIFFVIFIAIITCGVIAGLISIIYQVLLSLDNFKAKSLFAKLFAIPMLSNIFVVALLIADTILYIELVWYSSPVSMVAIIIMALLLIAAYTLIYIAACVRHNTYKKRVRPAPPAAPRVAPPRPVYQNPPVVPVQPVYVTPTAPAAPSQSVAGADEIKKYKDLLDSGVITQEEFDAKKKQLLGL